MLLLIYITIVLLFIYGLLIQFYKTWWKNIPLFSPDKITQLEPAIKITVIIPARNEEKHIINCLRSISQQTYPARLLQIIVVNDHSTDNTVDLVKSFPAANISLINLSDHVIDPINSYKKKAIEVAIAQASGELIVTTDADCIAPPKWIETIASFYQQKNAAFIAAPVKIKPGKSLLSIFQSLDFLTLQGITGAAAHKNFHSMCNGANLAYKKQVFYEVNGFEGIDAIASGDDMLLMHKVFSKYPNRVFYLKSREAIVSTQPAKSWKAFFNQRIRWASKADKYDDKRIFFVLLLVYLLNALLFSFLAASLVNIEWLLLAITLIVCKYFVEISFVRRVAIFFGEERLVRWFLFMQPLHIVYTVIAGLLGKFGSYRWKGRMVK